LIDLDAATNGLTLFYLDKLIKFKKSNHDTKISGIFEVKENYEITSFEISKNIKMIPSAYVMQDNKITIPDNFENIITNLINNISADFDYIILDTQAGAEETNKIAFKHSDLVVIVSEFDPMSSEGIDRLKRLYSKELTYEKTLILFNKILPEFSEILGKFTTITKYLSPIHWDKEVMLSYSQRKLPINMKSSNDYTLAVIKTAYSLLGSEIEVEINEWKKNREKSIKEPAFNELEVIEKEISEKNTIFIQLEMKLKDLYEKSKERKLFFLIGLIILFGSFITSMYLLDFINRLEPELIIVFTGFAALSIILIYRTIEPIFDKRTRHSAIITKNEIERIRDRISYLKSRKEKYQVIVDSDLEKLFKST
jgi:MinD-like ATPase involved in chromosome partitioning or flagellar assembly